MKFILLYILFVTKMVTILSVLLLMIFSFGLRKKKKKGHLIITDLSKAYRALKCKMQHSKINDAEYKVWLKNYNKQQKIKLKQQKADAKRGKPTIKQPCMFVLNFQGSINASEVNALREEITAILSIADKTDEVLLKLESPGGVVHGYGLAASQLNRLREHGIKLLVAIDKIATSGGYMMACVADKIIAAPFAIIGSIGVVAQIPNINRLLKKNDIDVELHTAGEYKRTLTFLGENTEQGRNKFIEELHDTHQLFKNFVHTQRPILDINSVATGEHWYGSQAKEKKLIDEIGVSDDLIINQLETHKIIAINYNPTISWIDIVLNRIIKNTDNRLLRWLQQK